MTTRDGSDQMAHDFYTTDTDFAIVDRVVELANQKGVKLAQIALAWLLHQPGMTAPVIGASKMYQLEDAVEALEISLSSEEGAFLEELYQPWSVLQRGRNNAYYPTCYRLTFKANYRAGNFPFFVG